MSKDVILELKNINKSFQDTNAIYNLNIRIRNGEFISILGPSGSGKSTILRIIGGFDTPDKGDIFMEGVRINNIPPKNRLINTVFQNYALFPHMNIFDNIAFGLKVSGIKLNIIKKEIIQIAEKIGLSNLLHRMPHELSGGERQRVAIARAILKKPKILLLDEPLSALDKNLRNTMQVELKQIQKKFNITFIMVTHDQEEALAVADRVMVINQGHLEQIGTPRDVYETPQNLFVAKFIGEINIFNAEVIWQRKQSLHLFIENSIYYTVKDEKRIFNKGDKLYVLFRPEDLTITEIKDRPQKNNTLIGTVLDTTYKGSTLDSIIKLPSGKNIKAIEFFDEDDEDFDYRINSKVAVSWIEGWEVILKDE
jgi:spermidine/putrescine transport system ATP-binding protein